MASCGSVPVGEPAAAGVAVKRAPLFFIVVTRSSIFGVGKGGLSLNEYASWIEPAAFERLPLWNEASVISTRIGSAAWRKRIEPNVPAGAPCGGIWPESQMRN